MFLHQILNSAEVLTQLGFKYLPRELFGTNSVLHKTAAIMYTETKLWHIQTIIIMFTKIQRIQKIV